MLYDFCNIYISNKTGGKPIETYVLHEVTGRNNVEEAFNAEKQELKKDVNDATWSRNQLLVENKKLTDAISRGEERKTSPLLDYSKLKCPRYLVELMEPINTYILCLTSIRMTPK